MTTLYTNLRAQRPRKTAFKRRGQMAAFWAHMNREHQKAEAYQAEIEQYKSAIYHVPNLARMDAAKVAFGTSSERLASVWKMVGASAAVSASPPSIWKRFLALFRR